jgi:MFS family permease
VSEGAGSPTSFRRRLASGPLGLLHLDQVRVLTTARVSMSVARSMAGVVVSVYLAERGLNGLEVGLIFAAAALSATGMSSLIGLLSDVVGRKWFLVVVPMLAAAAGAVFALTTSIPWLVVAACIGTFGRGAGAGAGAVGPYQPAESALLTESVSARERNGAFGLLATASSVGALLGTVLVSLLAPAVVVGPHAGGGRARPALALLGQFRWVFVAAAVLAALAGLIALGLEEDRPPRRRQREVDGEREQRRRLRFPRRSLPLLVRLWATNGVNGLAVGVFGPFVSYWLYRRFGASAAEIGVLFSVVNILSIASGLVAARVARRLGILRAIVSIRVVQGLLLFPLALAPSFAIAGAIFAVRMVIQRIGMPLRQSYVLALADPEERASTAALANVPAQVTMAGGPVLAGYLFDDVGLSVPFLLGGFLQLLNAAMYACFFRSMRPEEERPAAASAAVAAALEHEEGAPLLPEAPSDSPPKR